MSRDQKGQKPGQGSYNGYPQNGAAGQTGGYAWPNQNSGRQGAGYFQQNTWNQSQNQGNAYQQPAGWNPNQNTPYQQGAYAAPQGMGYAGQAGYGQPAAGTGQAQAGGIGQAGYNPQQNGYAQQGAWSQSGSYPAGGGYGSMSGSGRQAAYPAGGGYGPVNGSGAQAGYPAAGGYAPMNGSGSQPVYPGGYGPMNNSGRQAAYPGNGGYGSMSGSGRQAAYPAGGYPNPQGSAANGNSGQYIPQTPYGNGYPAGQGYPYPQGYTPYNQMGRNTTTTESGRQIPLNGAGYVPPPAKVRKAPFQLTDPWLILLSALLLILFAAGMFAPGLGILKWVFLALAVMSTVFLWIRPVTAENKRICYTAVFGALCLVTAVSLATGMAGTAGKNQPNSGNDNTLQNRLNQTAQTTNLSVGVAVDAQSGQTINSIAASAPTATPEPEEDNSAVERLKTFFYYWSANQIDEMLTLSSPSWLSSVESPKTAMFSIMANRKPGEPTPINITGTNEDQSRTVTIVVVMDKNDKKEPKTYQMNVMMMKENDQWYVDPPSLKSNDVLETENPNEVVTASPSPTPVTNGSTILYYNPDGGAKYHLDPYCKSAHEKNLPFKGQFTYAEVNDQKYAKLTPCNVCGAPLRGQ